MNIFVGNLLFESTEGDVKKLFEGYGFVTSVVIVMRKEKKVPKSRGFGFVEMPDEQQALAAVAALNGKEFMGRILNVEPARPKTEVEQVFNKHLALKDGRVRPSGRHLALKDGRVRPSGRYLALSDGKYAPSGQHLALSDGKYAPSGRPGTYKSGRRTHSYVKRHGPAGMEKEAKPWRRSQDNPMRWRKREDQSKPWQKSPGEHKPWEKAEGGARPWKKAEGEFKPWRKSGGGIKPWKKPAGDAKSWKRPAGDAKPWSKSNGRVQKSRFNPSTSSFDKLRTNPERGRMDSPGMVRGNGGRSRTKGRKNPGGYRRSS
jgi:hypothetical protein